MSAKVKSCDIYGWSGYRLLCGDISVGVVPEIGGRIISLVFRGRELLFVQDEHKGETFDFSGIEDLRAEKRRLGFRLWGGDKTWVAPQSEWRESIPPLELDAGKYRATIEGASVSMESPRCRETGLRITRRVELKESGEILLDQTLKNESDVEITRGIWNVTQLKRPFEVFIPVAVKALRPYPEEGDSVRLFNEVVYGGDTWAKIICDKPAHFKIGGVARYGLALANQHMEDSSIALRKIFETDPRGKYAHGASVEVYNSADHDYLEIEVHAPLRPIPPGGAVNHRQEWRMGIIPDESYSHADAPMTGN